MDRPSFLTNIASSASVAHSKQHTSVSNSLPNKSKVEIRSAADMLHEYSQNPDTRLINSLPMIDTHPHIRDIWLHSIIELVSKEYVNKSAVCFEIVAHLLCTTSDTNIVYITTKNTFSHEAISDIISKRGRNPDIELKRVIKYDVPKLEQLVGVCHALKTRHIDNTGLSLVVIDGIQVHFKDATKDNAMNMHIPIMSKLFQSLKILAKTHKFSVIVTNDRKERVANEDKNEDFFSYNFDERYRQFIDRKICLD